MPDAPTPTVPHPAADPAATTDPDGPAATPPPPAPVERYVLGDEIARGGMGVVYRATDTALGREVAVKVLADRFGPESGAARRFLAEARITGQLQHPGIPPVHDLGVLPGGRPFLAMKLIKGQTLDQLLASGGRQPPDGPTHQGADAPRSPSTIAVFEAVCQAVGYAHAHGVVHRDLKPQNVMVGPFGEVQVMDWGLAKVLAAGQTEPAADDRATAPRTEVRSLRDDGDETLAGAVLGTPAYMPPEQAIGAVDEVDERSDVFGLGAVLCAALTGQPPYRGDSAEDTRKKAARSALDDALGRLAGCGADPGLVALCRRCLSPEKADRPADGGTVGAEVARLRAAADDRAKQAELDRAAAAAEAREQRKRRRVQLALGSAVLLAVLAGGAAAGWQWRRAEGALADVTAEQGKTAWALAAVTAEQGKTAEGLADKTAEGAAKDDARRKTLAALRKLTDRLVADRAGRQAAVTDRDRAFFREVAGLWDEYARSAGAGEEADALRAEGAARVARLQQDLGEWAEAEGLLRAAIAGYGRLADARPDAPDYQARLARAHSDLGNSLDRTGRPAEATRAYQAAIDGYGRLAAAHPDTPEYLNGRADAQLNLGLFLSKAGRPADAERLLRAAIDGYGRAAAARPDDPEYQDRLAGARHNLSNVLMDAGRLGEAEGLVRAVLATRERSAAAHPADPARQERLAMAHFNLGRLLARAGRPAPAEGAYRDALRVAERLAAAHPGVPHYQALLGTTLTNLGNVLSGADRPAEAERLLRAGLAVRERLAAAHPADTDLRDEVGSAHFNLGLHLRHAGRPDEAAGEYRAATRVLPTYPAPRINLGWLLHTQGDTAGAVAVLREAAEVLPSNGLVRRNLEVAERAAALAGRLTAVRAGADRPASPAEAVEFAELCAKPLQRQYGLAARLYAEAFAADPALAATAHGHRYRAAAAAARAAAGDDPSLTLGWDEWGILQDQAFAWLSADLAEIRRWAESAHPNTRRLAADTLTNGQKEDAFASVRDPARRAGMPAPDRERWERFWAEVEAVRARAGPPTAPPPREAVGATR